MPGIISTDHVDIYDVEFSEWSVAKLSIPRSFLAAVGADGKVYFAGGVNRSTGENYSRIDIYDVEEDDWTMEELSEPRSSIVAAQVGDKIIFAGGGLIGTTPSAISSSDVVDIYDLTTGTWLPPAQLSQPRIFSAIAVLNGKAYIAGGAVDNSTMSDRVDIYDSATGSWSVGNVSSGRAWMSGAAAGEHVFFAGGVTLTSQAESVIDVFNATDSVWSVSALSEPRGVTMSASFGNQAWFAGGGGVNWQTKALTFTSGAIDIFDGDSGELVGLDALSVHRAVGASAVLNNQVFFSGGFAVGGGLSNSVDVYTDTTAVSSVAQNRPVAVHLYPVPCSDGFFLKVPPFQTSFCRLSLYSTSGQLVLEKNLGGVPTIGETYIELPAHLPGGVYFGRLQSDAFIKALKIVKAGR